MKKRVRNDLGTANVASEFPEPRGVECVAYAIVLNRNYPLKANGIHNLLLTISTTHSPASDLSFLLHKHPDRVQSFDLSFGNAVVFYPLVDENCCSACLLLDVDPVRMVRGQKRDQSFLLSSYVNDRPYVASSFMSVAISQVFGSALNGNSKERQELADAPIPLKAKIDVLPVRGDSDFVHRLFEPLGYCVETVRHTLDEQYPDWGDSPYYSVTLTGEVRLSELLAHLYVLIPVFDNSKHYFVSEAEVQKLLAKGEGWLSEHPEKEHIARRYLRHRRSLYREALDRLVENEASDNANESTDVAEETLERPLTLNEQRLGTVAAALRASGATSVIDLGCGEGKLLRELIKDAQFRHITGVDVSIRSLEIAKQRLKFDRFSDCDSERVSLLHGSLMYRDKRLEGFDAAAIVEVIEHLDPPRLSSFERVVFQFARPKTVVLTTPNSEFNVMWESLPAGDLRHADHRFEWTRKEFQEWANDVAERFGYVVRFLPVGEEDEAVGPPTQMAVFELT